MIALKVIGRMLRTNTLELVTETGELYYLTCIDEQAAEYEIGEIIERDLNQLKRGA